MSRPNIVWLTIFVLILTACQSPQVSNSDAGSALESMRDSLAPKNIEEVIKSPLDYEIQYVNWEIGNSQNINTVMEVYKSWDDKDSFDVDHLFCDTLYLRLPHEKHEKIVLNPQINNMFGTNRKFFKKTKNKLLSVVSLHDKESGQDWVFATLYNSWTEKSGKKDSVLLHENWLFKDGKIHTLLSFEKKQQQSFLNATCLILNNLQVIINQ